MDTMHKLDTTHHGADGIDRPATVYSEGQHAIWAIDGLMFARTGNGQLSNFISDWNCAHYDIQRHFGI